MGLPARKMEASKVRPRLRLVPEATRRRAPRGRKVAGPGEAECRAMFTVVALAFVALTIFAMGRVALTAELTRTAFDGGDLRQEIKTERQLAERLEADRSALLTPSRIEGIAAESMRMTQPASVRYIRLPSGKRGSAAAPDPAARAAEDQPPNPSGGLSRMISAAMDIAADEASALLVGDVGLASTR